MSKQNPVVLSDDQEDSLTLKSCATELFRWVRSGVEFIEESPAYLKTVSDDLVQAWHDSAKR